jgi:hypothetical protein
MQNVRHGLYGCRDTSLGGKQNEKIEVGHAPVFGAEKGLIEWVQANEKI